MVAQIIYATLSGDVVMAAAYSWELPRYGLEVWADKLCCRSVTGLYSVFYGYRFLGLNLEMVVLYLNISFESDSRFFVC